MVEAEGYDPIVLVFVSDREDGSDSSLAIVDSSSEEWVINMNGPGIRCGANGVDCEVPIASSEEETDTESSTDSTTSESVDAVLRASTEEESTSESVPAREDVASNTGGTSYQREIIEEDMTNEVYVPDVEIIAEIERLENEIRTQITVEQEQAVMMNVEEVDTNNKSTMIVAVSISIVVLLAIAFCMRVLYQRMNAEELEKLQTEAKQAEIAMTKLKTVQKKKQQIESVDAIIDQARQHGTSDMKMVNNSRVEDDEFEEQYNPLHDFAVFGVGNDRIGGNQTLQEKMNLADQSSSGEEEEEGESADDGNKEPEVKDKPKTPQFVAAGKLQTSVDSSIAMLSTNLAAGGKSDQSDHQS